MAITLEQWKNAQVSALIARGVNPLDAHNAVDRFVTTLPPNADRDSYVAPPATLEQDLRSQAVEDDLRAFWYGDEQVPKRFKRLLDAEAVSGG